jgi:hypothetical protein
MVGAEVVGELQQIAAQSGEPVLLGALLTGLREGSGRDVIREPWRLMWAAFTALGKAADADLVSVLQQGSKEVRQGFLAAATQQLKVSCSSR